MSDEQPFEKPKSKHTNRGGHGGPPGNQKGLKHGYYSLVRFIKRRGGALDKRTILGKMVVETVRQLEADLGGDVSTAQRMLIEDVALDTLLLSGLNKKIADVLPIRKGRVNPTYALRSQLVSQRREHLKLLGLKRVVKPVSLDEILSRGENHENADNGDAKEQPE